MTAKNEFKRDPVSDELFKATVLQLFKRKERYKEITKQFDEIKDKCVNIIDRFFTENEIEKSVAVESMSMEKVSTISYKVAKTERKRINFDPDKVEKSLGKEISKSVIRKQYSINDFEGFINYMKDCGADPKIIKSFIDVNKTVDQSELERLESIGTINKSDLDDCFTVDILSKFYTITN